MRKTRKIAALFLAALVLAALLAGCSSKQCVWCGKSFRGSGHSTGAGYVCDDCYNSLSTVSSAATSGSNANTGVWIAVIVMVFIAVFSATSGVVYLVLQKILPPEKPAPRTHRARVEDDEDYRAPRPAAPRPVNNTAPRPASTASRPAAAAGGVWICPRDKSRNTGPYCSVCGANRPAAPRPAGESAVPQRTPGQQTQAATANRGRYQSTAPADSNQAARARTAAFAAEASSHINQDTQVNRQQPAAPVYRNPEPVQQSAPVRQPEQMVSNEAASPARKGFRTAYVRPEQEAEPVSDFNLDDSGVDSELLAAIFREAARDPDAPKE